MSSLCFASGSAEVPAHYAIDVQVDPLVCLEIPADDLVAFAAGALRALAQPAGTELAIVLTTDDGIRELNRGFRGVDEPTDVLSFSAAEGPEFVTPAGLPPYLGDVILSYPTAVRQAAARGGTLRSELALLVVHGCLHLGGYDHATPEELHAMWERQDAILADLGFQAPPGERPEARGL